MSTSVNRIAWSTHDPQEAAASLAPLYGRVRVEVPAAASLSLSVTMARTGHVGVRRTKISGSTTRLEVEDFKPLKVGRADTGNLLLCAGRTRLLIGKSPVLFPQGTFESVWGDVDLRSVVLDGGAVQDYARNLLDDPGFRLVFSGHAPISDTHADRWTSTMNRLGSEVLECEETMDVPLIRDHVFRSFAHALLSCFPSTFSAHPTSCGGTVLPTAVRRAISFIDDHLGECLGVTEIAAAARLSPHDLVAGFHRHFDMTPAAYVRSARLTVVHHDLMEADPAAGVTVEQIARRWAFVSMTKFANDYCRQYGNVPDATLWR